MVEVLPAEVHGQCIVGTKDFGNLLRMGSVMTPKSLNPWDESLAEGLRFAAMSAFQCVCRPGSDQQNKKEDRDPEPDSRQEAEIEPRQREQDQ